RPVDVGRRPRLRRPAAWDGTAAGAGVGGARTAPSVRTGVVHRGGVVAGADGGDAWMTLIFLDMDGVLTDFDGALCTRLGVPSPMVGDGPRPWNYWPLLGVTAEEFWRPT